MANPVANAASPVTTLDAIETLAFALVSLTARAIAERGGSRLLTFQQWRTIVVVGAAEEPLRVTDVARRIAASGPSTSRIVQRLADHGLVEFEADPLDGRAVRIRLSPLGTRVRTAVIGRRRELISELIGEIASDPASDRERQVVAALEAAI